MACMYSFPSDLPVNIIVVCLVLQVFISALDHTLQFMECMECSGVVYARNCATLLDSLLPYIPDSTCSDYVSEAVIRAEESRQLAKTYTLLSQQRQQTSYDQTPGLPLFWLEILSWWPFRKISSPVFRAPSRCSSDFSRDLRRPTSIASFLTPNPERRNYARCANEILSPSFTPP